MSLSDSITAIFENVSQTLGSIDIIKGSEFSFTAELIDGSISLITSVPIRNVDAVPVESIKNYLTANLGNANYEKLSPLVYLTSNVYRDDSGTFTTVHIPLNKIPYTISIEDLETSVRNSVAVSIINTAYHSLT